MSWVRDFIRRLDTDTPTIDAIAAQHVPGLAAGQAIYLDPDILEATRAAQEGAFARAMQVEMDAAQRDFDEAREREEAFISRWPSPAPSTADAIIAELEAIEDILLAKNAQYGDSAVNPVRVFSKASPLEQLNVRIDDKLSRLIRGDEATEDEDVDLDLIGYLVLRRVARRLGA